MYKPRSLMPRVFYISYAYIAFTVNAESKASSESSFGSIKHSSKIEENPKLRFSSDEGLSREFIGRGTGSASTLLHRSRVDTSFYIALNTLKTKRSS